MRESVIYQEILQEGIEEGIEQGLKLGKLAVIKLFLTHRLGEIEPELQTHIQGLSLTQLDELSEALLEFSEVADLVNWLNQLRSEEVADSNGENGDVDPVV